MELFYNQFTVQKIASTSSPYFTPAFIDNACFECVNEVGSPAGFTSQCDICKTLTLTEISVITLDFLDYLVLLLPFLLVLLMIKLFRKK